MSSRSSFVGRTPWAARVPLDPLPELSTELHQAVEGVGRGPGGPPHTGTESCGRRPGGSLFLPGARLGPYRIGGLAGRGSFAEVYRAHHEILDQRVALKVIREPGVEHLEEQGARLMCRLDHPNIVRVMYADRIGGVLVIAMEFVDGETLEERLRREGPMEASAALRCLTPVCAAIEWLHGQGAGLAHLDLKPSNILIGAGGAKITDFGIARICGAADSGAVRGSPLYMAPEQALGRPVQQSDLWAFGAILFRMVVGRAPQWDSLPPAASLPAAEAEALPPLVRSIIVRCMEVDMEKRFTNAAELREEVEAAAQSTCPRCGGEVHAGVCGNCTRVDGFKIGRPPARLRGGSRHWRVAAVITLGAILLGAAGYGGYRGWDAVKQSRQRIDRAWQQVAADRTALAGSVADSLAHVDQFLKLCGACANRNQAEAIRSKWLQDAAIVGGAQQSESTPATPLSDRARAWEGAAQAVTYPRSRALALSRANYWRNQVENYDGYAELTAVSADGLPQTFPAFWSQRLPGAFLVARQAGVEVLRTRSLGNTNAPHWDESRRVRWKPGLDTTIELREDYWIASRVLGRFTLNSTTPDGRIQLKNGALGVVLNIRRESNPRPRPSA